MRHLARLIFHLIGWRTEGAPPASHRFVMVGAPHTSNWDAVLHLLVGWMFELEVAWLMKKSWFVFPLGPLARALGGVPVDRAARHGVVEQAIERFRQNERLVLTVPPEGTRHKAPHWKTGFYYIALGASVPIVLGFLDYRRKVAGFGPAITPTGDLEADFALFRDFYSKVTAKYPDQVGPIIPPPAKT